MLQPDHSGLLRQHDSGLHKQGGRYEIRLSLCSPLATSDVVQPKTDIVTGQAYPGPPQCHCGQAVQTRASDSNRMVPPAGGLRPDLQEVAQAGSGPVCNQVQSQTAQICVPCSGSVSLESGCSEHPLAESGRLCLSPCGSSNEAGLQVDGSRTLQSHSDCSRVAKHAMVLGPGQHVGPDSPGSPQSGTY